MTDPEEPDGDAAAPDRAPGAWGGGRDRRHGDGYDTGKALRELRNEISELRSQVRRGMSGTRQELREEFDRKVGETVGHIAELLPRVGALEDRIAELHGAGRASDTPASPGDGQNADPDGVGREGSGGAPDSSAADDDVTPLTPATGWDDMDRATAEVAWAELARFVDTVLFRQYRLTRLQIPDCWPLHPRMVRELAWLRCSYLEAQELEPEAGAASLTWHIRAVPGFLVNTADAVDQRECRPGVHRLTDPEVNQYNVRLRTARNHGDPDPAVTVETGPDRPQLHPEHFPTRGTDAGDSSSPDPSEGPKAPSVSKLPTLIVGACDPAYWLHYYREASAADLASRPS